MEERVIHRIDLLGAPWWTYFTCEVRGELYDVRFGPDDERPDMGRLEFYRKSAQEAFDRV
jgi:hypothetical protein